MKQTNSEETKEASESCKSDAVTDNQQGLSTINLSQYEAQGGDFQFPKPDLIIEVASNKPYQSLDGALQTTSALKNGVDACLARSEDSTIPESPSVLHGQLEGHPIVRPGTQKACALNLPEPVSTEQTKVERGRRSCSPTIHTLRADGSEKLLGAVTGPIQNGTDSAQRSEFKTTFKMVIHRGRADGQVSLRIAKLDTAADFDVLSEEVVTSLGMPMDKYTGPSLSPLGPPINPIGEIQLDWHIANREKTYTTRFAVLNNNHSRGFDALFGRETIERVRFYSVNDKVWFFENADVIHVTRGCQGSNDHNV